MGGSADLPSAVGTFHDQKMRQLDERQAFQDLSEVSLRFRWVGPMG